MSIRDYMSPRAETIPTSIKVSKDVLVPLKAQLKLEQQTIKGFFEAAAKEFLSKAKAKKRQKAS